MPFVYYLAKRTGEALDTYTRLYDSDGPVLRPYLRVRLFAIIYMT